MALRRLVVLLLALLVGIASAQEETFDLTILHTNDQHAAHEPNSAGNGGAARQATVVKQVRAEGGNVVLLDAGDRFTGSLYHTVYLGQDQVQIMNLLGYDSMTLGNHEFDNGNQVLADFLSGLNFPVVSANVDVTGVEMLNGLFAPYTVIDVNGTQLGVIGLTTATTVFSSSPDDAIVFDGDYSTVANAAAAELTEQGINKIVLLTHLGIQDDLPLLPLLQNIDVVLGGHSHTLYSNAYAGAFGKYPITAEDADGNPVFYAQAGANGTYLGRLNVTFDASGLVTSAGGDVVLLSRYITPDAEVETLLAELSTAIVALRDQTIGANTEVFLDGDRRVCRIEECNLGSIIADGLRAETGAQIGLMNGGGVRADIEAGEVTLGDVLTVHPFGNLVATFELSGADLLVALENSVSAITLDADGKIQRDGGSGRFLQVSGLRFTYDPKQEAGSRIVSVDVEAEDGTFAPLDETATYSIATINFVRTGGDGYTVFEENAINAYDFGRVDYESTSAYLASISPITLVVDAENPRITALDTEVQDR